MRKYKIKLKILKLVVCFLISIPVYSSESGEEKRNKFVLYSSPYNTSAYGSIYIRNRQETQNLTFLYGITNNYFIGINYNQGKNSESYLLGIPSFNNPNSLVLNDINESRQGEYISFKNQYFIWNDFYLSLNFGIENRFRIKSNKFLVENGNIYIEPISIRRNFSERLFSTIGVGYRLEFFDHLILGFEAEFGGIHSGKISDNYTFNPDFYEGIPPDLFIQNLFIADGGKSFSSLFFLSIYFGVSF